MQSVDNVIGKGAPICALSEELLSRLPVKSVYLMDAEIGAVVKCRHPFARAENDGDAISDKSSKGKQKCSRA